MTALSKIESFGKMIDRKRLRIHLKNTLRDLRSKDKSGLSESLEQKREENLDNLEEYIQQGSFPLNPDYYSREPYFIGPEGTACAVGYLMLQDGKEGLVNEIRDEENNIYLEDVGEGEIVEWIESSGLTKEEAERIQPAYGGYTEVQLATSCGPIACKTAMTGLSVLGAAGFGLMEYVMYKYFKSLYPDKPLKKGGFFIFGSYLNALIAVTGVIILYAILP